MDVKALMSASEAMWAFASKLVEKHGMDGDDTMTDAEHGEWQKAAGDLSVALREAEDEDKDGK